MTIDNHLFDQVGDAVRSLIGDGSTRLHVRSHRRGCKAWFGDPAPTRAHYEAQLIARRHVDGCDGMAIEVGFHAEHKEPERNVAVLEKLLEDEKVWRKQLGPEAEAGVFLGADKWRRVSEVWLDPDLDEPDLAFEMAARLVDYLTAIQPILDAQEPDS